MKIPISIALLAASALTVSAFAQDAKAPAQKAEATSASAPTGDAAIVAAQLPSYPLTTCVVSGEALDAESPTDIVHDGRLVRLCCGMCKKSFAKNPDEFIAEIDKAVVAAQKDTYPLEKCVVSDEKLGSMGDPIEYVSGTRLVRFCCKGCIKSFAKKPDEYLAKIDAALIEQQLASYPLEVCPFSKHPLEEGKAVNTLYGTRLVRVCCNDCVAHVQTSPDKALAMLDAATKTPLGASGVKQKAAGGAEKH